MKIQTLHNGGQFNINKALVMPAWSDEGYTLPHHYNLSSFSKFDNVDVKKLPHRSNVDILLGLDNSNLMRVLEEQICEKESLTLSRLLLAGLLLEENSQKIPSVIGPGELLYKEEKQTKIKKS